MILILKKRFFFFIPDLTYLPPLAASCPLKLLDARECSIKSVQPSFLRNDVLIDLRNNHITELPRQKTLQYLREGGNFDGGNKRYSFIDDGNKCEFRLQNNPLSYPPQHIFAEGKDRIISYLVQHDNILVDPNDFSILLVGSQMAGKSSLGLTLADIIPNSSAISPDDRTHAFDTYPITLGNIKVTMLDLGGHREYESFLVEIEGSILVS